MTFQQGLTTFRVGEPIVVENLSTPGFDEYILFGSKNGEENILDPQFLPGEGITYAYENEGVRQLTLRANKVVQGLLYTLEKSVTFDVGYAPNFSLVYEKRQDQSEDYTDNYSVLGLCFDVNVFQEPLISSPKIYFWNYGQAITFSSPENNTQTLQYSSLGLKFLGATISNRFGTGSDQIQIRCIDTPILKINVDPDNGQFRTNESIQISSQLISGNGHSSNDVATSFIIQGITYSSNPLDITFSQSGTAGITLFYQSKILTGLSGATFKQYEIVEILNAHVIHVSGISGNDSWSGQYPTISGTSGPVKTLNRAAELASAYSGERNIEIQIQEGNYRFLEQSFYLNASNSGVDKTITYKPYLNSQVIISGGYTVSPSLFALVTAGNTLIYNRLKLNARGNVYEADLSSLGISFGDALPNDWNGEAIVDNRRLPSIPELYYNSNKMTVSRWPNKATSVDDSENPMGFDVTAHITSNYRQGRIKNNDNVELNAIFGYTSGYSSTIDRWSVTGSNPQEGIWLHGFWRYDWSDEVMKVASIDKVNRRIEVYSTNVSTARQPVQYFCSQPRPVNPPHPDGNGLTFSPYSSNPTLRRWYAFNLLEELDSPGEYYLDRYNKKLYFWPPSAITATADVVLSSIRLSGGNSWVPGTPTEWSQNRDLHWTVRENTRDTNASLFKFFRLKNVIIDGLMFRESCGSMIELNLCENVTIKNCKLYSPRRNGIVVMGGKNNVIDNCEMNRCGLHSVILTGGDRQNLIPANNILRNSKIIQSGKNTPTRSSAIRLAGVGNTIQKNVIADCPGGGIIFTGNDHIIEYNNLTNVSTDQDDWAGIYSGGNLSDRGIVIRYNFFNNVKTSLPGGEINRRNILNNPCSGFTCAPNEIHLSSAIYFDEFNSGFVVDSNVFYMSGTTKSPIGAAIFFNMGIDHVVKNNIFVDVPNAVGSGNGTRNTWETLREGLLSGIGNSGEGSLQSIINVNNDPWYENGGPENMGSFDYTPYSFYGAWYGVFGTFSGSRGLMNKVNIKSSTWTSKYPLLAGPGGMINYDQSTLLLTLNSSYPMKNYMFNNVIINQLKQIEPFIIFPGSSGTPINCGSSQLLLNSFEIGAYLTGGTELYSIFQDKSSLNFKLTPVGLSFIKTTIPDFIDIPFEQIPTYP